MPCSCQNQACDKPGKHPRISAWPTEASTDESVLRRWWGQWPRANVGLACGAGSGFWAMDVDGPAGRQALRRIQEEHPDTFPRTPHSITGGGGDHYLFAYEPGLKNEVRFARGLDLRTDGGLIVAPPSIHATGAFYIWDNNADPQSVAPAPAPDYVLKLIRESKPLPARTAGTAGETITQGSRNQTLWSSGCAMRRRGMTENEIYAALAVANEERCDPALPEEIVRDLARRAAGYAPAPANNGVGPAPPAATDDPLNSFDSLNSSPSAPIAIRERPLNSSNSLNSSNTDSEKPPERGWPPELAAEAFHGIAGEIVQRIAPETEADPAALLVNFLVAFGSAVGRGPKVSVLTTRHHANLYGALVGTTGEGSKGSSWDPIEDLFTRSLPTYTKEQVVGGISSGEGLIWLVRDRIEKRSQIKDKKTGRMTMEFETVIEDEGIADKRCLVVAAEMTSLLKIMNRPGNVLSEMLREAWDRGDLQNLNKNSSVRATDAHISVLGHITPLALRTHLTEAEAANGFGNRFLWMLVRRSQYLPEGGTLPYLNNYITNIKSLVELASDKIMARSVEAKAMWAAVYQDLREPVSGMFGELIARRAPIVARLALVYALLDGYSASILPEHLLAALAVWERAEASVYYLFGDATGDPVMDALYDAMRNRPEGATRTDLHAALGRNRPAAEIDRALSELQRAGKATMRRQKGEHDREVEVWLPGTARGLGPRRRYLEKAKSAYENNEVNENSEREAQEE